MEKEFNKNTFLPSISQVKEMFKDNVKYFGIKVKRDQTQKYLKTLKDNIIKIKNVNPVGIKGEVYNTILTKFKSENKKEFDAIIKDLFQDVDKNDYEIVVENVELNYDNFLYSEIIKKILPSEFEGAPSSFETIGKIAHLNLRENFLPYKHLIGQIILDKNPYLTTVINKTSKIDNVFRTYEMEVLAGEENFDVLHKEGSCTFQFDIRKVYWCSRLQAERERVIKKFKKGEVLCDAFCGVGPLAVKAAKAGIRVIANDLNPNCYEYLQKNIKLNKVSDKQITSFNMDAREFIRAVVDQTKHYKDEEQNFDKKFPENLKVDHFYMNLPKDALEFLDVFVGLFNNTKKEIYNKYSLPIVHVYGFSNARDPKEDIFSRIAQAFSIEKFDDEYLVDFHNVRDVSNHKHMFCVSLRIPPEVAYKSK